MTKQLHCALALAAFAGCALAQPAGIGQPGYAYSYDGRVVMTGQGQCLHTGQYTPANAIEPCDPVARAAVPAPAPLPVAEPAPVVPAPLAATAEPAPAPRPVLENLTLATDVLFAFNQAELSEAGKQRLDQLAAQIRDAQVDEIAVVGYADRIASAAYNQKLSEQRAQAVKRYLDEKRVGAQQVVAEGKGEFLPVTGASCLHLGPERASNRKLVDCLQPDRRVEIEVFGTRVVESSAATGSSAQQP